MYNKEELLQIKGGAINWTIVTAISSGIVFIIGIIDGYLRPLKCNK